MLEQTKKLYDRLEPGSEKQQILQNIIDGAVREIEASTKMIERFPEDMKKEFYSDDPDERLDVKLRLAKAQAMVNYVKPIKSVRLESGESAPALSVRYDQQYLNCITIFIQNLIENLKDNGSYKACCMQLDREPEEAEGFVARMKDLEKLYDGFEIRVVRQAAQEEKGILAKLFGRKTPEVDEIKVDAFVSWFIRKHLTIEELMSEQSPDRKLERRKMLDDVEDQLALVYRDGYRGRIEFEYGGGKGDWNLNLFHLNNPFLIKATSMIAKKINEANCGWKANVSR